MNPVEKERLIHGKLNDFLRKNAKGMTMSELVKEIGFSRKALEKHLQILVLENEIYMKQFGNTKVYYPNHRIRHFDFEKLDYNNKTIWFDILESEFGKYILIQKKKKANGEWVHEHSITLPLALGDKFIKALDKILHSERVKKLLAKDNSDEKSG